VTTEGRNQTEATFLSLQNVNKSFGALTVTKDISLDVAQGETVGIIGPNGAGKSTLFNLITGDIKISGGQIRFRGKDITHWPARKRAVLGIGRTYQIPHPFSGMTVYENTLVGALYAGGLEVPEAEKYCAGILDLTELEPLADKPGGTLRLLERKRLELARALSTKPSILLLDEIAGGLTDAECVALLDIIATIRARGVTIIWIEHVIHALLNAVERLVVLDRGELIADGEPTVVMNMPVVRETYFGREFQVGGAT
jgi:branched-chain amino acid transport system ATP-binding protein